MDIKLVKGNELHRHYRSQTDPQPCYVELNCSHGTLRASYVDEIGGGAPVMVYYGHWQRWAIPPLKADAANALLARLAPLAERVYMGYSAEFDGHNNVARFDADARAARREIETLCDQAKADPADALNVVCATDWLAGIGDSDAQRESLGIAPGTSDERLAEIAEELTATAQSDGVDVVDGLDRYLAGLRNSARDEGEE